MNILELYDKRAKAWEAAKAFLDSHTDKDGNLSAEDAAAYDKMEKEVVELGKSIDRLQRQQAIDNELSRPTSAPITNEPKNSKPAGFRASNEYKAAMLTALRTEFRQVSDVLEEGTDANGGYLVPEEYDRRLIDVLNEENIMRSLATKITDELLYDNAFGLENYIITQFGKALANAEEDAFLNGDGNGKPKGMLADAETGVTTSGASMTSDDIIDLIYSLKRPYRKNASFMMNDSTIAAIRKLRDNNNNYIWQPAYQAGEPDRLLGYTLHTSAFFPEKAAGKAALAFGDYSYYNIGDRGSRSMQQLKELFAGNGMVGYLMKERVDGLLLLPEAVKVLKIKGA